MRIFVLALLRLVFLLLWLPLFLAPCPSLAMYSDPRAPRCDGSIFQRGENVPATTSDRSHEIVHASSIQEHGKIIAWFYKDRDQGLHFQAATDMTVPGRMIRSAMETFSDSKFSTKYGSHCWTQQVKGSYHPEKMAGHSFLVHACY